MTLPTWNTWYNKDYIKAVRLIDIWMIYRVDGRVIYIYIEWSTQICANTFNIIMLTSSHYHIPTSYSYISFVKGRLE